MDNTVSENFQTNFFAELYSLGFDLRKNTRGATFYSDPATGDKAVVSTTVMADKSSRIIKHFKLKDLNNCLALPSLPQSSILYGDVDTDVISKFMTEACCTYTEAIDLLTHKIESFLGSISFLEVKEDRESIRPYGFHFAIRYDRVFNDTCIHKARQRLKDEGIRLDFRSSVQCMRLPLSYNYRPVYRDSSIINSIELLYRFIDRYQEPVAVWQRRTFHEREFSSGIKKTGIHKGQRCREMIRLAYLCIGRNMSLEDYQKEVRSQNIDSVDLSTWSQSTFEKQTSYIYNWCSRRYINRSTSSYISSDDNSFISNMKYLSERDKDFIPVIAQKVASLNYAPHLIKKKTEDFIILISEITGYRYYQDLHPRRLRTDIYLKNINRNRYLHGYQFSSVWMYRLKSHYNLRCDIKKDISTLLSYLGYTEIRDSLTRRNWSFGSYGCSKRYTYSENFSIQSLYRRICLSSGKENKSNIWNSEIERLDTEDEYMMDIYGIESG